MLIQSDPNSPQNIFSNHHKLTIKLDKDISYVVLLKCLFQVWKSKIFA